MPARYHLNALAFLTWAALALAQHLYRAALHPQHNYWLPEGDHNRIVNDDDAAAIVKAFFDSARPRQLL